MLRQKLRGFIPLALAALGLCSCLGVSADISVRENGSGKIVLEYRVSPLLESLGKLDGNERWQTIPVGRPDFERSLERLPGLRLVSFSTRETAPGGDTLTRVELEFTTIEDLLAFLDPGGGRAVMIRENGTNRLSLRLMEAPGMAAADPDLRALLRELSRGYELRLAFSAPAQAALKTAPSAVPAARIVSPGKTVSLSLPAGELLDYADELGVEITW